MFAPILMPLAILGGMDGVEPLRASVTLCEEPKLKEIVIRREERLGGVTAAGVREIARLTGYSPAHVCYARRGVRISRPLRRKMAELGLRFK